MNKPPIHVSEPDKASVIDCMYRSALHYYKCTIS